jgi:hypothetical protein
LHDVQKHLEYQGNPLEILPENMAYAQQRGASFRRLVDMHVAALMVYRDKEIAVASQQCATALLKMMGLCFVVDMNQTLVDALGPDGSDNYFTT